MLYVNNKGAHKINKGINNLDNSIEHNIQMILIQK